jgi:uncharacterized membrane protein YwaF
MLRSTTWLSFWFFWHYFFGLWAVLVPNLFGARHKAARKDYAVADCFLFAIVGLVIFIFRPR